MAFLRAALLATIASTVSGRRVSGARRSRHFLAGLTDLRPDVAAKSLSKVEDDWLSQVTLFIECTASTEGADSSAPSDTAALQPCSSAPRAFKKSCSTVTTAMVEASGGEGSTVKEYMADICSRGELGGWKAQSCQSFTVAVLNAMTADSYINRVQLAVAGICDGFWSSFLAEQGNRLKQERRQREAEETRQKEEAAKKAAEEAEVERKREEEAEKKRQEEAERKRQQEAAEADRKQAEEAKRVAAEAAERLRAKDEEMARAERQLQEADALASAANGTNASNASIPTVQVLANASLSSAADVLAASAAAAPSAVNDTKHQE